jgi:hypothetical protein
MMKFLGLSSHIVAMTTLTMMRKITMSDRKSYSELIKLKTAEERFEYLRTASIVGESTFGFSRYLNQRFYTSKEWREFKRDMILRDNGCDMGLPYREIPDGDILVLHHINPLTLEEVEEQSESMLDPENVICVSDRTHKAIHFGDISQINTDPIVRKPNDTCPWKV